MTKLKKIKHVIIFKLEVQYLFNINILFGATYYGIFIILVIYYIFIFYINSSFTLNIYFSS